MFDDEREMSLKKKSLLVKINFSLKLGKTFFLLLLAVTWSWFSLPRGGGNVTFYDWWLYTNASRTCQLWHMISLPLFFLFGGRISSSIFHRIIYQQTVKVTTVHPISLTTVYSNPNERIRATVFFPSPVLMINQVISSKTCPCFFDNSFL
jgi:hypothetical protein